MFSDVQVKLGDVFERVDDLLVLEGSGLGIDDVAVTLHTDDAVVICEEERSRPRCRLQPVLGLRDRPHEPGHL